MRPAIALFPFLWFGAAAQVQVQPFEGSRSNRQPQAQTGKASVEGSVLDAVTGEPVKKASVMLNGQVNAHPWWGLMGGPFTCSGPSGSPLSDVGTARVGMANCKSLIAFA